MRWIGLLAVLATGAGCYSPRYENGKLQCQAGAHPCPDRYHCAITGTCWSDGATDEPRDQHTETLVLGAGGGIGASSGAYRATTSFGQPAGVSKADSLHSVQFGILAGSTNK
jgi:hypothetical protein